MNVDAVFDVCGTAQHRQLDAEQTLHRPQPAPLIFAQGEGNASFVNSTVNKQV